MQNSNTKVDDGDESAETVIRRAEELVQELRQGNNDAADSILQQISKVKETSLYSEVGKMTRQLHDALEHFRKDTRIYNLAEEAIPDAKARLSHVISMTQQAADKTLNAVESTIPVAERISTESNELGKTWKKFRQRELSADEFRTLADDIEKFLGQIGNDSSVMKENLNEVLMAQGFQDITGQIIKQVITLVEEVETNLVDLVRLTGNKYGENIDDSDSIDATTAKKSDEKSAVVEMGPHVPGVGGGDIMETQDDVDDLLSSLGF
ncbi:MAG: protein phosphatase CheZ [Thiohalomonadales bacterium]